MSKRDPITNTIVAREMWWRQKSPELPADQPAWQEKARELSDEDFWWFYVAAQESGPVSHEDPSMTITIPNRGTL